MALALTAGDADDAASLDLGDLADHAADRPGRAGDHDGLAGLGPSDVEQAEVGGHARHAQDAEVYRQRRQRRIDLGQAAAVRQAELLHAERARHMVAHGEPRVAGGDHPAHPARTHDLSDLHGADVRLPLVHPAAHGRVQREVRHLDQQFASPGSAAGSSTYSQSVGLGSPTGRAASRYW